MTALTATLTGFGAQAFADDRPFAIPPGNTTPPAATSTLPDGPLQIARAKAKSSGKPATVDELTTQKTLIVANPDGTVTRTDHLQPARVKLNGKWTDVNATLAKNGDGTFSPKATPSGVTLSGGGTSPLAAFTDPAGHRLALTLPFALPTPSVSGDTATYTNVLPGVDLKANVTDQGAFREVLVVHDATAAANPQLKTLRLAVNGSSGLTTSTDAVGNFTAKAPDGTPVFTAPTPVMWDSSKPSRNATPHALSDVPPAPGGKNTGPVEATDNPDSSDRGPGRGAHITPLKVQSDRDSLTLTPDPTALSGSDIAWPLYIDPYVNPAPGKTNHYTQVKEGCPSQTLYDQAQTNGEGIGYQQYDSNCFGLYRSFYEFDTSNLNSRMSIGTSTIYFTETYGADNGCNNQWPVELQLTGTINSGTAWPGPAVGTTVGTQKINSSSISSNCGNHPVNFDVTNIVKQYIGSSNLTFGLYGDEGKYVTNYGFMRFSTNPYMQTTYDIAPNAPANVNTTPASQNPNSPACGSGSAGWIGMTTLSGNASNLTLNAQLSTDMSGVNMKAGYHVWDNMVNNGSGSPADAPGAMGWPVSANWLASGSTAYTNIGGPLQDGHQYGWNVWATDGWLAGPSSPYCYFNVDLTPPSLAAITPSTVFPPLGIGSTPTGHAGDAATVTVSSKDPVPTGCTLNACIASGVDHFQWSIDSNIPGNGGNSQPVTGTDANGNSTATISIQVPSGQWGTHTLYVEAVDKAGNAVATPATYSWYAPWNPVAKVTAGDLTGDGIPDMLGTTSDGNLTLVKGNSDGSVAPEIASTAAQAPDANNQHWDQYLIAHRGSVTQQTVDDLFAYSKPSHSMYLYMNDATAGGTSGHFTLGKTQNLNKSTTTKFCLPNGALTCASYPADWSQLTQMVAAGPLGAAAYNIANPTQQAQTLASDLITVESGQLWYYIGGTDPNSYFFNAYPIGTGDWSNTTLVGVGMVGAHQTVTGSSTYSIGGNPTLWARNNATGAITSYPLTFDNLGNPTSNLTAPASATTSQPTLPVNLSATAYPAVTTPGDVNGDGNPDLYATGTDGKITVFPGATAAPASPPTDRWQLADSSNSVRTANGLTLNGSAAITSDNTRGNVLSLNGTTGYANSASNSIDTSKSFTVSAWVRLSSTPAANATAVAEDGTQNSGFYLEYNAGVNAWCLSTMSDDTSAAHGTGLSPCSANGSATPNTWVHLAGVYDATAKTAKLYVNGNLAATTTGLSNWAAAGNLTVGAALYHGARTDNFPGAISDVKTFNSALPAGTVLGDVSNIAQFAPATTLGYLNQPTDRWKLTDTTDAIRSSNNLTLYGGGAIGNDSSRGSVFAGNGTSAYAATGSPVLDTSQSYTVSAWAKLSDLANNSTFVSQSGTNANGLQLYYSAPAHAFAFGHAWADDTNGNFTSAYGPNTGASAPQAGTWFHLVGVYDSSSQRLSLYINGSLATTATYGGTPWNATGPLQIGRRVYKGTYGEYVSGAVSDVEVWSSPLAPAAIATLNSGVQPITIQIS